MIIFKKIKKANSLTEMIIFCLLLLCFHVQSQDLKLDYIIKSPEYPTDKISGDLVSLGWKMSNVNFVPDSSYVRRSWEVKEKKTNVNSYFIFYEFTLDTTENYIIYQFADRDLFKLYRSELKRNGYKIVNPDKKKNKRKKDDPNMYKERVELFYLEKTKSLTVVKEVFYYGLNSFLIYSYRPKSAFARHIVESKED